MRPRSRAAATGQAGGRSERGQIGGIEVLPFGILTFVCVTLLVVNAWAVIDAKMAVNAAAREATRAYVEADSAADAAAAARARASETLDSYGRAEADRYVVEEAELDGAFGRCVRVTITVAYEVPTLRVPFIGGFGHGITARATHSELIDPYRSGLPEGGCG